MMATWLMKLSLMDLKASEREAWTTGGEREREREERIVALMHRAYKAYV